MQQPSLSGLIVSHFLTLLQRLQMQQPSRIRPHCFPFLYPVTEAADAAALLEPRQWRRWTQLLQVGTDDSHFVFCFRPLIVILFFVFGR